MSIQQVNCKNCEKSFNEAFEFCPHCGQKVNDELTLRVLFYNTISNYFSFDARFVKSFIPLLVKPGYLAQEFIKGKRLLYLHPAQMYLFISIVFFFIFSFSVQKQVDMLNNDFKEIFDKDGTIVLDSIQIRKKDSIKRINDSIARYEIEKALRSNKFITGMSDVEIDSIVKLDKLPKRNSISFGFNEAKVDSLLKANASDQEIYTFMGLKEDDGWFQRKMYIQMLKFYKAHDGGNVLKTFYDSIPIALFFLLPLFALILKVLYFSRGLYAHHLVFGFYYFSYLFTVFSIIFGMNLFLDIPDWIDVLIAFSTFIYLLMALKRFYRQGWFLTFFKGSVATFTFMAIVIPTTAIILGLYAFLFY